MVRKQMSNLAVAIVLCFIALMLFLAIHFFSDHVKNIFGQKNQQVSEDAFVSPK
jgi:hypothetical protein